MALLPHTLVNTVILYALGTALSRQTPPAALPAF
jgi:hypothetical protein